MSPKKKNIWGIILAGGDGVRLQNYLAKVYNYTKPKQFCTIVGTRSLYRHTIDRALMFIPANQIISVITHKHLKYINEEFKNILSDQIFIQPANLDTGPGLIIPLLKMYQEDPERIICVFPSDHFILEEKAFISHIKESVELVLNDEEHIVMVGVKPYDKTESYGIILPGNLVYHNNSTSIYTVRDFFEKPVFIENNKLKAYNYLWNTMVMVSKCKTFINAIQKSCPEILDLFYPIRNRLSSIEEYESILSLYKTLPRINFSKQIIERIVNYLLVIKIEDVYWSDWGEEERILLSLEKLNKFESKKEIINSEKINSEVFQ